MVASNVSGKEWLIMIFMLATTVFTGLVQAGATSFLKDIYILQLTTGERLGFWATCRMTGNSCVSVSNETPTSPSGAFHAILVIRYFLLAAAILYGLVTLLCIYYSFSDNDVRDSGFVRIFRPVSVVALIVLGGVSMSVSTLVRALEDGGSLSGVGVVDQTTSLLEIFLWVSVGSAFATTLLVLGIESIFGSSDME